jgi:diguanylate cyclase (GGDEF)-like protein/PAS domain S-box-containing protein
VSVDTIEQKRAALIGWVYSPYRMNDLMAGILNNWATHKTNSQSLQIYDTDEASPANLLFERQPTNTPNLHSFLYQTRTIDFNGHHWLLIFSGQQTATSINYVAVWATLIGGLILTGLVFAMFLIINQRSNALSMAKKFSEEIKKQQILLQDSEFRWKFAIEGTGAGLWDWNLQEETIFFSKTWKKLLGYSENEIGTSLDEWTSRIHPDDKGQATAKLQAYVEGKDLTYISEYRVICKDKSYKWLMNRGMVVSRSKDNKPLRIIGTSTDTTKRKDVEEQAHFLAFYDYLTGLPNRRLLADRLSQALASSTRSGCYGALMVLDLDNFKQLNDKYGHNAGDLLLNQVASRIKSCLREKDTVARFGGDEFVVIVEELNVNITQSMLLARIVAEKIRSSLSEPYFIKVEPDAMTGSIVVKHSCTASVGGTLFVDHETSTDEIFKRADVAMYQVKGAGRNAVFFLNKLP